MNKIVNLLETGEKQWGCELLPYNFTSRNKTKQSNLLTLTVSCEKRRSCLISSKKRSQNKTKNKNKKGIEKLIKVITEAIIVIIS